MGFLDKLLGREQTPARPMFSEPAYNAPRPNTTDEQALARYRYMLQTAPPETLEQAHEEAFAKLTPEQRRMALEQLSDATPESERAGLSDDPRSLARAATRAEMREPGTMERRFGGGGMGGGGMGGMGIGGMMAAGLLTSIAGGFIGSAIAGSFFNSPGVAQDYGQSAEAQQAGDADMAQNASADSGADAGADTGGDGGGFFDNADYDSGGGDFGGDFGGDI